jgi:tetratricopeptide (TPR) repeat protein
MRTVRIWISLAALVFVVVLRPAEALAQACDPWVARIVAVQGEVGVSRGAQLQPAAAKLDEVLCVGDRVQVGAFSRAALALPDETVVRLDQNTIVTIQPPRDAKKTWLDILKGILHVISRDPRALGITTPFANAGIEGTEFVVAVGGDATTVIVYEGRVRVVNTAGAASAGAGESVLARAGLAPVLQQVVRPRDAVVWTLYYPPTSAGTLPAADAPVPAGATAEFYVGRAEQRLAAGQVAAAEADLASALALAPGSGEVLARQAVIALTQNDTVAATELADRAVAAAPDSAAARLAQSYARQAAFDLPGAIASLEAAAAAHPGNALVRARLAELWLASGELERSERDAYAAVAADPNLSLAQTVLGFVSLTRIELKRAEAAFNEAIRLQSDAPLPRLGLGLTKIRDGHFEAGRQDIERAVILDPGNSLLRSYMGKAYYEEKRDGLAASQFQLAKDLDPKDPTPWYYDAILKQSSNRPVEALADLNRSSALNDDRAVYRSRFLLDDDAASRTASVSSIYTDLGFESLATLAGTTGLAENFSNSSAHRLLAYTYSKRSRYDIARVSEAFQAQIRQPLTVPPVNLLVSVDELAVLRDAGPLRVGLNEYSPLFNRDEIRIQADGTVGSQDTFGNQFVASGLAGRVAYSVSQLHYETDGYLEDEGAKKNAYDGFVQFEVNPELTLQLNARTSNFDLDNTFFEFDPDFAFPTRISEDTDMYRVNGRYSSRAASEVVWTVGYEDRDRDVHYAPLDILVTRTKGELWSAEVQRVDRFTGVDLISGGSYVTDDQHFPVEGEQVDTTAATAYAYLNWQLPGERVSLATGLAFDQFDQDFTAFDDDLDRSDLSPKLGLIWAVADGTTVRAAAFESIRRPLMASQTIEPTTVVGFNQFFAGFDNFYGDPEGNQSRRAAVAVDQRIGQETFAGIEGSLRKVELLIFQNDEEASVNWREKNAKAYIYRAITPGSAGLLPRGWNAAVSLEGELQHFSRPVTRTGPEAIKDLDVTRIPVGLTVLAPFGVSLRTVVAYTNQEIDYAIAENFPVVTQDDDAWITDVFLEFRLPERLGIVSFGVRNVFDSTLTILETDPLSPRVAGARELVGTISLTF